MQAVLQMPTPVAHQIISYLWPKQTIKKEPRYLLSRTLGGK